MVARPSSPTRSGNAGEFSRDAAGRVDIKQYYSAGLAFKNVEPVPQGGWRQMGGTRRIAGNWRRPLVERAITSPTLSAGPHVGTQTVWTGTVAGTVAAVWVNEYEISAGTSHFWVEALVGGVWTPMPHTFVNNDPATPVTRLAAFPPGEGKAATGLRVRAILSTSATVGIAAVVAFYEDGAATRPRHVSLIADNGVSYSGFVTAGHIDFFTHTGEFAGAALLQNVDASMLPDLDFYTEGRTIGIFHGLLVPLRIFLADGNGYDWRVDTWPFGTRPVADLGGVYAKNGDVWEIFIRWVSATTDEMYLQVGVNGEKTPAVQLSGPIPANVSWAAFATNLQGAINALPSIGSGVTVAENTLGNDAHRLVITFGPPHDGQEFQVDASVQSSVSISASPVHYSIGKTQLEPLFSFARGWPGTAALIQDRMAHARIHSMPGAIALSEVAEYFEFNIEGQGDNSARLDRLRSQTKETVLFLKESTFALIFTDRGVYFAENRTIERNTPINFVLASETGMQPNCRPFDLDGVEYYVAIRPEGLLNSAQGGKQLLSIVYNDVAQKYNAEPVSLLASHLVDKVIRAVKQKPADDLDAARGWLMRSDGRLICGQFIPAQEILGFCEWISAVGLVREIGMDGTNRLWMAVDRDHRQSYELYDPTIYLQDAVSVTPDLAGLVSNLPYENGAVVYAVADGFDIGPFIVQGGVIDLGDAYTAALVGRWQAPRYETMPQVFVTPGDDVVWRPGRIHTAHLNVMDTTSLAVGANGQPAMAVPLTRAGDPVDQPPPARSELVTVTGLPGSVEGPTMTVTQTRPGRLRVRDFSIGAKL